jgi:hypothetical protein
MTASARVAMSHGRFISNFDPVGEHTVRVRCESSSR